MIERCLASVRADLSDDDELVLVDSCSSPDAAAEYEQVAARHGVRLVRADRKGVNIARNLGCRTTSAPLLLFTDDDVEVEAGWADAYAACFAAHPEVGFAT